MIEHTDGVHTCWFSIDPDNDYKQTGGAIIEDDDFYGLPADVQTKLCCLIAEVAEAAYRRGVQQAAHMRCDKSRARWLRFEVPPGVSVGIDGFITTAQERLLMECGRIHHFFPDASLEEELPPDIARSLSVAFSTARDHELGD